MSVSFDNTYFPCNNYTCFWIMLFSIFGCNFNLTQINHEIVYAFKSCCFLSLDVNSPWHTKITWFTPILFEYLYGPKMTNWCKSSARWGLVLMLRWDQVWRLWWDLFWRLGGSALWGLMVGIGEEIGVGKGTLLLNNHHLTWVSFHYASTIYIHIILLPYQL